MVFDNDQDNEIVRSIIFGRFGKFYIRFKINFHYCYFGNKKYFFINILYRVFKLKLNYCTFSN